MTEQNANVTDFPQSTDGTASNSTPETADVGGVAGARLKSFVERIERLEEEKAAIASDIKDVYAEAKGTGFDAKTLRKIVSLRKVDTEKRREADEMLELYKSALGME